MLKFDLYRKLPQDLIEPQKSGALISFTSLILIILGNSKSQGTEYLAQQVQTEMYIDQNKDDTLLVNMDISFLTMPCDFISIDQQDIIGTHQQNVEGELYKSRILNGKLIDKYLSKNESLNLERTSEAYQQKEGCDLTGYIVYLQVYNMYLSNENIGFTISQQVEFLVTSIFLLIHMEGK